MRSLLAVCVLLASSAAHASSSCPIPGFTNAAFADTSFSASGTIDSWDSSTGAYSSGTACTDPTSCTDSNSCAANIGTNASSISSSPSTSGTCTANANLSLPIPTAPTVPAANQLGAIGSQTITGPGTFTATSISESGNGAVNFKTASPNGPVVVYVSGNITFSGNGALNNDSLVPSNVLIMCTGAAGSGQTVTLNGNGNAYFTLYCPQAAITLNGGGSGGQIWGAIVGKTITGNGSHAVTIHYDKQVANMTNGQIACTTETARSSPIVATLAGTDYVVQGTTSTTGNNVQLTTANTGTWTFPAYTGHMRARTVASVGTAASSYSSGTILFDASTLMPAANYTSCGAPSTTCRYIFTNSNTTPSTGSTWQPSTLVFSDTNASAIGAKIITGLTGTQYQTVLHTIMSASLGGVDRSTVAVIEPGTIVGGSRPTIAYFGAADGMLHAVCADEGTAACPTGSRGKQLWAFMPRVELPLVQYNEQRIDGSVHVADLYGDFSATHTGTRSWKTVLTFQTGYSNTAHGGAPASYAIDVTDPSNPTLLWEYTTPTTPAANDYGTGLVAAMGQTMVNGALTNLAVLETNNGGSGTAAVVATAVQLDSGNKLWQFSYTYPTAAAVPANALPGGAVGVDLTGAGNTTDYVMGDLYGDLWRLDAQTGASQNGTSTPLFKFSYNASTDKHPIGAVPAIYSDGSNQYVAVAAGGYADQVDGATSWSLGTHYLVAVKIKATSNPVLDTATASNSATGDLRLKYAIASSSKAYSQPTIVGNQLFVTSDTADVNSASYGANQTGTGRVLTVNGINGAATSNSYDTTTSTIYGGASSLVSGHDASGNLVLVGSSSDKQSQVGNLALSAAGTGIATTTSALGAGSSVDTQATTKVTRNLWLRSM